ncbi:hypothetical protein CCP2SC5_880005 [Azospirillaceae bacterium]
MYFSNYNLLGRNRNKERKENYNYSSLRRKILKFYTKRFKGRDFTLYPIGDWHAGSRQFCEPFAKKIISEIKDNPKAWWCGMGDMMENAIIGSKSDIYTQNIPPKEQLEHIVDMLSPIKHKGLFLIYGNHETRTMRMVGLQPEQYIGLQLGLPVMGFSCMAEFLLPECHTPYGFSCYFHHTAGGSYATSGKIGKIESMRKIAPTVDAVFTAHHHMTARLPQTWYECGRGQALKKTGYDYGTGSALTWDGSYAEEKGSRPATVEHIKVTFVGSNDGRATDGRRQIYEVISGQ